MLRAEVDRGFGARLVATDEHHVDPLVSFIGSHDVLADEHVGAAGRALALTLDVT